MTTTTEDVITHCDSCKCGEFVDCMENLCSCTVCACRVDAEGVSDITLFALRAWKLVYGEKG